MTNETRHELLLITNKLTRSLINSHIDNCSNLSLRVTRKNSAINTSITNYYEFKHYFQQLKSL